MKETKEMKKLGRPVDVNSKRQIEFENDGPTGNLGFLSKEGYAKLSKQCSEYVSNDTEMDVDYV